MLSPSSLISFSLPLDTVNYLCATNMRDIQVAKQYAEVPDPPGSLEFLQVAYELMTEHQLDFPQTIEDAMCLYAELVALIEAELQ